MLGSPVLDRFLPGYDASAWAAGPIGANDGILIVPRLKKDLPYDVEKSFSPV